MKKILSKRKQLLNKKQILNKKGFTLIEMIIVIAIIAILIALIAPNLMKFLETANKTKTDAAAKTLYTSAQTYVTSRYIEGDKITAGEYDQTSPSMADFMKEYFNTEEMKEVKLFKIKVTGNAVEKVWVEMNDGEKSTYPREASDDAGKQKGE